MTTAIALAREGDDVGYAFDRKEAKDHGEGGVFVGTVPRDGMRVVVVDDVVAACEPSDDPDRMRAWYRHKLLDDDSGIDDILRHLIRRRAKYPVGSSARDAIVAAIRYCGKRRNLMRYAALRRDGLPIGSGATESGCALFQLRVKHPGSHWGDGLPGALTARGLFLSDRWDHAFDAYHHDLLAEVTPA